MDGAVRVIECMMHIGEHIEQDDCVGVEFVRRVSRGSQWVHLPLPNSMSERDLRRSEAISA